MYDAYVAYHARARPRALALITPQKRATYAEFDADVNRYAAGLMSLGVSPARGIVSVDVAQSYRRHVLLMALARLGVGAGITRDPRSDLRISDRPGESGGAMLRLSRDWIARVESAAPHEVPSAVRDPDGVARVLLSSGTTKLARRVPMSWRRMEASSLNAISAYASGRLGVWAIRSGIDSGLGNSLSVLCWTVGAALAADHAPAAVPGLLERHPVGLLGLTPVQLRELLTLLPAGFELKPRWRIVVTGAAMPPALAREARMRVTPDIQINYATTEAGRAAVGPAERLDTTPGSVGWPVPGAVVEVVGADGQRAPDGEQGEVRIRSDRVMGPYIDDPEASAAVFRDGWFYPGDLGRRLPDGSLVIDGRTDERMNFGGVKVLPNLLENALMEHPEVRDAAAFSAPDAEGVEHCWMAVTPAGEVTRDSLMQHLRRSGIQLPAIRFAWSEAIPRNEMGKIDRNALRTQTVVALKGRKTP